MKLSSLRFRLTLYFIKQSTLASILKDEDEILAHYGCTNLTVKKSFSTARSMMTLRKLVSRSRVLEKHQQGLQSDRLILRSWNEQSPQT